MDIDFKQFKCIAIMGGTFNPIHKGHLNMAKLVLEKVKDIDKLIFMPNNMPAYKDTRELADASQRIDMLRCALKELPDACISMLEINRGGVTYTADTLDEILSINPDLKIYFIIGMDSLYNLHHWHRYKDVVKKCVFLVFDRDVYGDLEHNTDKYIYENAQIKFIQNKTMEISSSEIRSLIAGGSMPYELLPDEVADYIEKNKLYIHL